MQKSSAGKFHGVTSRNATGRRFAGSDALIAFGLSRPDDGYRDLTLAVRSSPGHYTSLR
jgi:hypothetical protein